jgi:hypothetical protein
VFIITVVHWYNILLALKASVDRKPMPSQV